MDLKLVERSGGDEGETRLSGSRERGDVNKEIGQ